MRFSSQNCGGYSAGNGPAMRSPILGVCFGAETERLKHLVCASTRLTHTDPKAEFGAIAVALAAHLSGTSPAPVSPNESGTRQSLIWHA